MKAALLIIDMQVAFLDEYQDRTVIQPCCDTINFISAMMRNAGQPVIHIQDISEVGDGNDAAYAISPLITQEPSDLLVTKTFANAFHKTTLASQLQTLEVSFLILCGQAAEQCVVFSYNGAQEQGFSATVLQDGVISPQPGRADMLFQDRAVISYPAIKALLS